MIPTAYLTEVANYTLDKINKVVINSGAHEITSFTIHHVVSSTVELEYWVPLGSVTTVTLIEIKSSSGQLISSNVVNIPILSDTIIEQVLIFKEV